VFAGAAQVTFGSAPGVPNWGRLLQNASDRMDDDDMRFFDTLFVVDPCRAWYGGASSGQPKTQDWQVCVTLWSAWIPAPPGVEVRAHNALVLTESLPDAVKYCRDGGFGCHRRRGRKRGGGLRLLQAAHRRVLIPL